MIPFHLPNIKKDDIRNVIKVCKSKVLVKNNYSLKVTNILKKKLNSNFIALTQSGSDALEVAFNLLDLKKNDEVIIPSYTFSATANAVILANGKPVFADINKNDLCIDLKKAEKLINKNTKALCLVHYSGISCDFKKALYLKKKYKIKIIEDAAHALFSKFEKKFCGTIGDIGIFSFHESKNFTSAQGGAISINNKSLIKRGLNILNKGNSKILSKKNYYYWVDKGSEYEMSELSAALLYNQIKNFSLTQNQRSNILKYYYKELDKKNNSDIFHTLKTKISNKHSCHIFALVFKNKNLKKKYFNFMKKNKINVKGHYYPLHLSPMGKKFKKTNCKITEDVYDKVIRLPIYPDLKKQDLKKVIKLTNKFIQVNK